MAAEYVVRCAAPGDARTYYARDRSDTRQLRLALRFDSDAEAEAYICCDHGRVVTVAQARAYDRRLAPWRRRKLSRARRIAVFARLEREMSAS